MLDVYYTFSNIGSEDFTRYILDKYYNITNPEFCKTINGKPYIKGDKIFFNASHSKDMLALAVGKKSVGLDIESLSGKARPAVQKRFSEREQAEIYSTEDFYEHWTAKESYIKYLGETLAIYWRKVELYNGKIYFSGKEIRGTPEDETIMNKLKIRKDLSQMQE